MDYLASYENRQKVAKLLEQAALDPDEGDNVHEIAYSGRADTIKKFANLEQAILWAKDKVARELTVYGVAEIREIEEIPMRKRCRYCICNGRRLITRHNVQEEGIVESFDEDGCAP